MTPKQTVDVFISYRRKDVEFTKRLVAALQEAGKMVWIDWEDIPPGSEGFTADIRRGLEACNAFICILTPAYMDSTYTVDLELGYAVELKKKIIPIALQPFEQAPMSVAHINWIYFYPHAGQPNRFETQIQQVIDALDADYEHAREHSRLQVRALEWQNKERKNSFLLNGDEIRNAEHWLHASTHKQPEPTRLHIDYIHSSRAAADRAQRLRLALLTSGLVVSIFLTILSFIGFQQASEARATAVFNADAAQTAQYAAETAEGEALVQLARAQQANATAISQIAVANGSVSALQLPAIASSNPFRAYSIGNQLLSQSNLPDVAFRAIADVMYYNGALRLLGDTTLLASALVAHPVDPDRVLIGYEDGTLAAYNVRNGAQLWRVAEHITTVTGLRLNADGTRLASASGLGDLILWDLSGAAPTILDQVDSCCITALALTPAGERVLLGRADGRVEIRPTAALDDVTTHALDSDDAPIVALDVHPLGGQYVSAGRRLLVRDLASGAITHELVGHRAALTDATFDTTGTRVISTSQDTTGRSWSLSTGAVVNTYDAHREPVTAVGLFPDGSSLVTVSSDETLVRWDALSGQWQGQFQGHEAGISDVVVLADNETLVSIGADRRAIVWDSTPTPADRTLDMHRNRVRAVVALDASRIITASLDSRLIVTDVATGAERVIAASGLSPVLLTALAALPAQERAFVGSNSGLIRDVDLATGADRATLPGHSDEITALAAFALPAATDAALVGVGLVSSSADGSVRVWDANLGEEVRRFEGHGGIRVNALAAAVDSEGRVLVASGDLVGRLLLWKATTGEILHEIDTEGDVVYDVAFSGDALAVVAGLGNDRIARYDVATGVLLMEYEGHTAAVTAVAVDPDDAFILSGDQSGRVIRWGKQSGQVLQELRGHRGRIDDVAIAPDGQFGYSAGADASVIRWPLHNANTLRLWTLRHRVPAQLTCEDRERFNLLPTCEALRALPIPGSVQRDF